MAQPMARQKRKQVKMAVGLLDLLEWAADADIYPSARTVLKLARDATIIDHANAASSMERPIRARMEFARNARKVSSVALTSARTRTAPSTVILTAPVRVRLPVC